MTKTCRPTRVRRHFSFRLFLICRMRLRVKSQDLAMEDIILIFHRERVCYPGDMKVTGNICQFNETVWANVENSVNLKRAPKVRLAPLQSAARLIARLPRFSHISTFMAEE